MLDRRDKVETVDVVSVEVERWKAWKAVWPLPAIVTSELNVHEEWNCILLGTVWEGIAERSRLHVRLAERQRIVFPVRAWCCVRAFLRRGHVGTNGSVLRILRDGPDGPIAKRELAMFALQGKD